MREKLEAGYPEEENPGSVWLFPSDIPQVPPASWPLPECLEEELRHPGQRQLDRQKDRQTDQEAEHLLVVVAEGVRDAEF